MIVFGILGHAKAGKDTCVDYVLRTIDMKQLNGDFKGKAIEDCTQFKVDIADGIRDVAKAIGFKQYQLNDQSLKEKVDPVLGISPRQAMQGIGSAFRNTFGADFWLENFKRRIGCYKHESHGTILYVTDLRLPREIEWLKEHFDATIIKIERPDLDLEAPMYQHHTEKFVDMISYDRLVVNDGTLKDLYRKLNREIEYVVEVCESKFRERYDRFHDTSIKDEPKVE